MVPEQIEIALEKILPRVSKPGRYTGGEYNQVVKDWDTVDFKVCTAFPDIYDLGMSNLGLMILYNTDQRLGKFAMVNALTVSGPIWKTKCGKRPAFVLTRNPNTMYAIST